MYHCPIYSVFKTLEIQQEDEVSNDARPKPSWPRASQEEKKKYQDVLEDRLNSVQCPASVAKCQDKNHQVELDIFANELLVVIQEVAEASLPVPKGGQDKTGQKRSLAC